MSEKPKAARAERMIGAPVRTYSDLATRAMHVAQLACSGAMEPDTALKLVRVLKDAGQMVVTSALLIKSGENPGITAGALTYEEFVESQLDGMTEPNLRALAEAATARLNRAGDGALPFRKASKQITSRLTEDDE